MAGRGVETIRRSVRCPAIPLSSAGHLACLHNAMTFTPSDRYLWDFWFAPRAPRPDVPYHLFHLQAPQDLPDPERRHAVAAVGHAVSADLVHWKALPIALAAGAPGNWDDRAIWTGSIIEREGIYYFFYTGTHRAESGLIQRIGLATSTDLIHWRRHPANPLVVADPRWYETLDLGGWPEETCRDPWVVYSPAEAVYYMFFTARVNYGPADGRGVIGCARSPDLLTWEMLPPVSPPGEFGYLEVPQVVSLRGRFYMLFCTAASKHAAHRLARTGSKGQWSGTGYLVAEKLTGPYRLADDAGLVAALDGPQAEDTALVEKITGEFGWRSGGVEERAECRYHFTLL